MRQSGFSRAFSRRRGWTFRLGIAMGVGSLAVALLLFLPVLIPKEASPEAAAALNAAARAAEQQQPYEELRPGDYYYSKSVGANLAFFGEDPASSYGLQIPDTTEGWLGRDGSARFITIRGTPRFLSGRDRGRWQAAGADRYLWEHPDNVDLRLDPGENLFPFGGAPALSYEELIALPPDPDELFERIDAAARASGQILDYERFVVIGDLLRHAWLRPELQAALYRTAARLPGVELVGEVRDPADRQGIAVGFVHAGIRDELIFDPNTGRLLAERDVLVESISDVQAPPGTIIGYSAYGLEDGIVKSATERPTGVGPVDTGGACVPVSQGGEPGVPQPIQGCNGR